MRIFLKTFFIFLFIVSGANAVFAQDVDYKNNLLKVEVTKENENTYDIGIYTQKLYNEPVKVIKKSDTMYYLLLPETNNSVTSVSPVDAVKSVMVKCYPYAGQDMPNGYTKVAVITSKPVNLTTSLRTVDTSISPKLDPTRLARLDRVFERYSERLAQNNVPTPLNEFRKAGSAQKPALSNEDQLASAVKKQAIKTPIQPKPVIQPKKQINLEPKYYPKTEQKQVTVQKPQILAKKEIKPQIQPEQPKEATKEQQIQTTETETKQETLTEVSTPSPVEVEFESLPGENEAQNTEIIANKEIIPEEINKQETSKPLNQQNNNLYFLGGLFILFFIAYIFARKHNQKRKAAMEAAKNRDYSVNSAGIKDYLQNQRNRKQEYSEPQIIEEPEHQEPYITEDASSDFQAGEDAFDEAEDENIRAFNAYMEQEEPEEQDEDEIQTDIIDNDDDVIRQLYTPIEAGPSIYGENSAIASYDDVSSSNDGESASIISSAKLTETRGLYLAKFEGSTVLVGYIQDDIFVLYNFGEGELENTNIKPILAEENETDSIYMVKVAGKELMIKSAPYDIKLITVV